MDGNTEPLIAVIGHPIAGNPSQFAIEQAMGSLSLDYRLTSFDVAPHNVGRALDGLDVLGFCGVLVDPVLSEAVTSWIENKSENEALHAPASCLFRDTAGNEPNTFSFFDAQAAWLLALVVEHFQQHETQLSEVLWLGGRRYSLPSELQQDVNVTRSTRTPTIEMVSAANLIILSSGRNKPVALHASEWPQNDGSTLVVDLTDEHDEDQLAEVRERGYTAISNFERKAGVIYESVRRWTQQEPDINIILEAMEEYLGV